MFASQSSNKAAAKSTTSAVKRPNSEADTPEKRQRCFTDALARHGKDAAFSDFEISCQGISFPVHRLVISMHSSFFERLCKSGFRETKERRVDLSEDPPAAVCLMIHYFYSLEYTWIDERLKRLPASAYGPSSPRWGWFLIHAQLAVLADKYGIEGLGTLATKQFGQQVDESLSTGKKTIRHATADLLEATRYVYENTGPDEKVLRGLVIQAFKGASYRLLRYTKKAEFQQLLGDIPEFAADYIAALTGVVYGSSRHAPKVL